MPNQYINKVEFGGNTIMDITDTTAEAGDVIQGQTFYNRSGAPTTGALGDATTITHGLMSAADKEKLDAISAFNCQEFEVEIQTTDWSNGSYTWTNAAVTTTCLVLVDFQDDVIGAYRGSLNYTKVTGGVQFDLDGTPTDDFTVVITIIDAASANGGGQETDPTIYEWAKAATKPTYTAQEVGALPADTVIPTVPTNVSDFTNDAGYLTSHQDISGKADKADTVLDTTLSRGRKANTTVGTRSFAFGEDVTASNNDSHAEGRMTVSSGTQSHAEGNSTTASGSAAHAEGQATTASGEQAHAEGGGTVASGHLSHAEGGSTTASGTWSHAEGGGTIASGLRSHAEGQGGTFSVNMVRKTSAAAGANSHSEGYSTLAEGESSHSEGTVTYASGYGSHAEGSGTQATGSQSHAEGGGTEASGSGSHSEGGGTHATGLDAHAEGQGTVASGDFTHAQGNNTTAAGRSSHVFGENNIIDSYDSWSTWVSGTSYKVGDRVKRDGSNYICKTANSDILFVGSKWENPNGKMTYVEIVGNGKDSNNRANARTLDWQGNETLAGGLTGGGSIAMGGNVTASRNFSIAVGGGVAASGDYSQAFGSGSTASGSISYAEGQNTVASGNMSHAEGSGTQATSVFTHAEGCGSTASGSHSHAEGNGTKATNYADHAEGNNTTASGGQSHAEGSGATSAGFASHAEGYNTKAANGCSHAEGYGGTYTKDGITYTSQAAGYADHVEGYQCLTENHQPGSHAEGYWTRAEGNSTHSEGAYTVAKGNYSHAEGYETIATGAFSHVSGQYNTADSYDSWAEWTANTSYSVGDKVKRTTTSSGVTTITAYVCKTANSDSSFTSSKWTNLNGQMNYAEIIGNGTSNSRSNARALDWDGNEYLAGDLYVHANSNSTGGNKVATLSDISGLASSSNLATVATSGSYTDLSNTPTIPTALSDLTDDVGYLTSHQDISGKANSADLAAVATTGDYDDLLNKPTIPTIPINVSTFTNDAGYLIAHQDISGKANSADLATVATTGDYDDLLNKPTIPTIPTNVSTFTNDSGYLTSVATMTGATSSDDGTAGLIPAPASADREKFFRGDGTWQDGGRPMVILSYGNSTWAQFEEAYNNNVIVYCRASSNSNPASGSQTRMAFMAYVNNATTPTEVEFQYYRSMSSHSATAMGDQVFVYKLTKTGGWTVTTRDASIKEIKAATGTALNVAWSSNVVTLTNTMTADTMPMSSSDATTAKAVLDGVQDALAIVVSGDTAPANIASGAYIFLKGHSTLASGGYHATAAISSGDTISNNNVAADSDGIANALSSKFVTDTVSVDASIASNGNVNVSIPTKNGYKPISTSFTSSIQSGGSGEWATYCVGGPVYRPRDNTWNARIINTDSATIDIKGTLTVLYIAI